MKTQEDIEHALSLERFATYLNWTNGDLAKAIQLYTLNTQISECLYTPIQMLEVVLRNRIHVIMSRAYGDDWFQGNDVLLINRQKLQIKSALHELTTRKKNITPGAIVAELSFSFWTSMLNKTYENLWQKTLHEIARTPANKGVSRKALSAPLTTIRVLRNRVAHHEPILAWHLPKHYENIMQLIEWLSPAAHKWCQQNSRFMTVYPTEPMNLNAKTLSK